jgi:signal transduction histidine kinase
VRDLAEVYGGTIALESSPIGGVSARLRFPK